MTKAFAQTTARRSSRSVRARLAACAVVALLVMGGSIPARGQTGNPPEGLREIAVMPSALTLDTNGVAEIPPPLRVDVTHNLGFAIGFRKGQVGQIDLAIYNLASRTKVEQFALGATFVAGAVDSLALDEQNRRIFAASPQLGFDPQSICALTDRWGGLRWDYTANGKVASPFAQQFYPCSAKQPFIPSAASYDPGSRKIYRLGTYGQEGWRGISGNLGLKDNDGQALLVQQLDVATLANDPPRALDWEIDLRAAGCGRRSVWTITRVKDSVLTYCSDTRPASFRLIVGEPGYVVRIPLNENDMPESAFGGPAIPDPTRPDKKLIADPDVRLLPAIPGDVTPIIDEVTGRVLLVTTGRVNGNALWVHDPLAGHFVGAITGGDVDPPPDTTAAGFDQTQGRAYVLTPDGIIVADTRRTPLPPGLTYDVATDTDTRVIRVSAKQIAVAPQLRQLFIPVQGHGYLVVEDNVPPSRTRDKEDPDRLTTTAKEEEGKTSVNTSGAAQASGAHIVAVGGAPRLLNNSDPFCHSPNAIFDTVTNLPVAAVEGVRQQIDNRDNAHPDLDNLNLDDRVPRVPPLREQEIFGDCLANLLVSNQTREALLAHSFVEAGSAGGAIAEAGGLIFPPTDFATDRDFKDTGECRRGTARHAAEVTEHHIHNVIGGFSTTTTFPKEEFFEGYGAQCEGLHDGLVANDVPDMRAGTAGPDHQGFPVPSSHCEDLGDDPENEERTFGLKNVPQGALFWSAVGCDASEISSTARASSTGFAFPDASNPVLSVARASSEITSLDTAEGRVTVALGTASGLQIGPVSIGEVRSIAVSKAKGHAGTTSAEFLRLWCRVGIAPGFDAEAERQFNEAGCINPDLEENADLVEGLNRLLMARAQVTLPAAETQATDRGYQAVVTKDSDLRGADRVVNSDNSFTVPAVQVTVYNDGIEGRSRMVVQLAGVHVESRYGIIPIPEFSVPEFESILTPLPNRPGIAGRPGRPAQPGRVVEEVLESARPISSVGPDETLARQFLRQPGTSLSEALRWLWNNPTEALLLSLLWAILATPLYLFLRRRALDRAMTERGLVAG